MKNVDVISSAINNTFRSKMRTTLTVLAIFIGAFTLTITSGLGTGINRYIDSTVSAIRILRDVPPTPIEIQTSREAFMHLIEPAKELGVTITEDDITFSRPTILIRPLAIFK